MQAQAAGRPDGPSGLPGATQQEIAHGGTGGTRIRCKLKQVRPGDTPAIEDLPDVRLTLPV